MQPTFLIFAALYQAPDSAWAQALDDTGLERPPLPHGLDEDDDSWPDTVDCAPADPTVFPGAEEICDDGLDNDCDEKVDLEDSYCTPGARWSCGGDGSSAASVLLTLFWIRRQRRALGLPD